MLIYNEWNVKFVLNDLKEKIILFKYLKRFYLIMFIKNNLVIKQN